MPNSRHKYFRETKKLILIGSEGNNKTERIYFSNYNRRLKNYRIIFSKGNNTDPIGVIMDTIRSKDKEDIDLKNGDRVYCLLDCDVSVPGRKEQIKKAVDIANKHKIVVLLSNPAFEIWFINHVQFTTAKYNSSEEVTKKTQELIAGYHKSMDVFEHIYDMTKIAIDNVEKLKKYHRTIDANYNILNCQPDTDVIDIVKLLVEDVCDDHRFK